MRYKVLPVKNVVALQDASKALMDRPIGLPGMGMVSGPTGYGKTTACTWLVNQVHGVYVRALRLWTPKSMLSAIARELDIHIRRMSNAEIAESIVHALAATGRPLFLDEADYVIESRRLTDTLRDIHDMSTVPMILIGMHGIERRIRGNEQLTGRMSQWVRFSGADMVDARMLADGLSEVKIEQSLLKKLHAAASPKDDLSGAEIRRLMVGIGQIENYAVKQGLDTIGANEWPKGRDFFIGQAVNVDKCTVTKLRPATTDTDPVH